MFRLCRFFVLLNLTFLQILCPCAVCVDFCHGIKLLSLNNNYQLHQCNLARLGDNRGAIVGIISRKGNFGVPFNIRLEP